MKKKSWVLAFAAILGSAAPVRPLAAQLPVFSGDPVDPSTALPYSILPGVALVLPGEDEKYDTDDDIINGSLIGDIDVIVRTGGGYAGGPLPPPAAGIAAAPSLTAGGVKTGTGSEVPFQVILSDGASSPPLGNPLLGPQHDGRGAIVLVFPDLDGDGVVGPHSGDGSADNEIEKQEAYSIIGRQLSAIENGVASGNIAVSLGAPASSGGLGAIVTAGVLMGATGPEYFDGPWVSTLQPIMPPVDPERLIGGGGGVRPPVAGEEYLVEIKTEFEKWFLPAPGHPILGTPYAVPTDGSSPTVDLLRSNSAAAAGAAIGVPVDAATFTADPARRVLPGVASGGGRLLIESVAALGLADDGPGNGRTILVFAADLLGNPADVASPIDVVVETGPTVSITSPDSDSNPQREVLELSSAAAVPVTVDDAGGAGDGNPDEVVLATVLGVPTSSVRAFGAGGGTSGQHDSIVLPPRPVKVTIGTGRTSATKVLRIKVRNGDLSPTRELPGHEIRLIAQDGTCPAGTVVGVPDFGGPGPGAHDTVTLPGGSTASAKVTVFFDSAALTSLNKKTPTRCRLDLVAEAVAAGNVDPTPANNVASVEIDITDLNDPAQATAHESAIDSLKPIALRIGRGSSGKTTKITATVKNGDLLPQPERPGHLVNLTVDPGDCPPGTIGDADFDLSASGEQSSVTVAGGKRARGQLVLSIDASAFNSSSAKSPARCTAELRVTGPGGDADASNDTTRLIVDVTDNNDF